ncbi:putative ribosomal protein L32-like protein [Trypanosoma theileri]|uniref:Putative ribosomal protein L32-like protein n=1 Tax=Trypanosoma theileri TaxID=67003 RepID=A0A1X0P641_9TRYP|nr:putative ribosomal protein L32-like protein [Trypanosoma theileri]ORC92328.1 putative ribosomal protein L32-like protein [Trypanosoma theileri]
MTGSLQIEKIVRPMRSIAVFGSSTTARSTPEWEQARHMGALAAQHGFSVITGGYGGSMEAVSQGARETIQQQGQKTDLPPQVIGVTASVVFPHRNPRGNKYLTRQIDASSIMERIQHVISMSRYFVVLPGSLGSLQELICIWILSLLQREGIPKPVIIAFRDPWEKCILDVCRTLNVADTTLQLLHFVNSTKEAMQLILEDTMSHSFL